MLSYYVYSLFPIYTISVFLGEAASVISFLVLVFEQQKHHVR